MRKFAQPWLGNPLFETIFIVSPAIVPVLIVFTFHDYFTSNEVSTVWWVLLVLCIDVSHVYSTLFRLYWDKGTFSTYKKVLITIPIVGFLLGFGLHFFSALIFWRVLAYVAVFHFIRQQYGFMRLYSRKDVQRKAERIVDTVSIYNATLYPLLYWHIHATNELSWFVRGDFIEVSRLENYFSYFTFIYFCILIAYMAKEGRKTYVDKHFNVPKNLIIAGTYLSWHIGIVTFQGDLIFTLLNVVAHGIPYMGLIWLYGQQKSTTAFSFNWKGSLIFLTVLFLLAYFEENLWDALVWKDHADIFPWLSDLTPLENPILLSIVVPLLVLPQVTHYVLDGFIWRFSKDVKSRL
jgi:hypothetical protein